MFYNGSKEVPEESILRLSDAYEQKEEHPDVELKVRMINIHFGQNQELMKKCHRLWEYAFFVEQLNQGLRSGLKLRQAAENAIDSCVSQGVLEDILTMSRREVIGSILSEYDEKKVQEYLKKEAWEMGLEEGRKEGMEAAIRVSRHSGGNYSDTLQQIEAIYQLEHDKAVEYMKRYWDE